MATDIYELKRQIEAQTPGDEPPWKVYGRIKLKTGIRLATVEEGDTVSDDEYSEVKSAAEEVLGEDIDIALTA